MKTEAVASAESLVRSILFTAAAVTLGVAALFVAHFTHWVLAVPFVAVAISLLLKARPRLLTEWREMDRSSAHPVAVMETSGERERCSCCGAPTFSPGSDTCLLCEWSEDLVLGTGARISLDQAVRNYRKYGSVYPPNDRPEWSTIGPTARELAVKRELARAYVQIDAGRKHRWFHARRLERRVEELEFKRIRSDQAGGAHFG